MNHQDDNDDIPGEVDFRGGVRGKYADRYREGVVLRERTLDPIGLYEIQSRLGRALLSAQAFETALATYLALVVDLPVQKAAVETRTALEFASSTYLHNLRDEWEAHLRSAAPVETRLSEFFRERNWLVHQSWQSVISVEEKEVLNTRLEALTDEADYLRSALEAIVVRRLVARGMSNSEIVDRTKEIRDYLAAA